jgi:hypothetical protein
MTKILISGFRTAFIWMTLGLVIALPACSQAQSQSTPATTPAPSTQPTISAPLTSASTSTRDPLTPPTPVELTEGYFYAPDFPRITCEKLKQMIDDADATGDFSGVGGMRKWNKFNIIDTRGMGVLVGAPGFNSPGHIPGAFSMPVTYYWVTDPAMYPREEQIVAYHAELDALVLYLDSLNKAVPLIIYDGTPDDYTSILVGRIAIERGFDPKLVLILNGGFGRWYYDLGYSVIQGDYNYYGQ